MIYVVLGIIILFVSFIVALVSLIYEQKRVEEMKGEGEDELAAAGELLKDDIRERIVPDLKPSTAESSGAQTNMARERVFEQKTEPQGEEVWWNKLENKPLDGQVDQSSAQEEASINAIREELSRMVLGKNDQEEMPQQIVETEQLDRNEAKRQRVLVGEFSLRDARRGN